MGTSGTHAQQEAFLRAIVEDPQDDTSRLVYADWLEEHGQAERGQFIRVQVALARLAPDDPGGAPLRTAERKLSRGRLTAWKAELPKLKGVTWGPFTRGFVGSVTMASVYRWHQYAGRIVAAAPVEALTFRRADALRAVANSRHVTRVRALDLQAQALGDGPVVDLANSANLGSLEILNLRSNQIRDAGARALAGSDAFPCLSVLDLSANLIGPGGARALAASAGLARLTRLEMTGNRTLAEGREALRASFGERVRMGPQSRK